MTRIDLHFHILPGLDDGPSSIEESLELARAAVADGTGTVVATPHVRPEYVTDVAELAGRIEELEGVLAAERIELRIRRGAELGHMMVSRLQQSELESVALGPPGGRWLLVESPFAGLDAGFSAATDELRDRGFAVVVAHPERAAGVLGPGRAIVRRELERGSILQVNAWSLAGRHGGESQIAARELVAAGHPLVLASDAHGGWRMPALGLGVTGAMELGLSRRAAERLVGAGPRRLLERGIPLAELTSA